MLVVVQIKVLTACFVLVIVVCLKHDIFLVALYIVFIGLWKFTHVINLDKISLRLTLY